MQQTRNRPMGKFLLIIAFVGFISLGLPDGLLGVAWPSMSDSFTVPIDTLGILLASVVAGYMVSTVFSGKLVRLMGIGRLLGVSTLMTSIALSGYTLVPSWIFVLPLGAMAGFGGGAIDAALNSYIARHHRQLLYWLHAMFGVGTTIGPLIMTGALNVATWRAGYLLVAAFQFGLAMVFFFTAHLWDKNHQNGGTETKEEVQDVDDARLRDSVRLPVVWVSVLIFLLYTGIEISVGQWSYTLFHVGRGIDASTAGLFVGLYWGAFTVGRALSGVIVLRLGEMRYLQLSFAGMVLGSAMILWNPVEIVGLLGLPVIGFALAPVFPALIGSTQDRVGAEHASNTIGFEIGAASLGGAIVPGVTGILVRATGFEAIAVMYLLVAVLTIVLHEIAVTGRRPRRKRH